MEPFLIALIKSGLGAVANAVMEKGAGYLQEKTGIQIDLQKEPTSQELTQFKQFMLENETELQKIQIERDHITSEVFKAALADNADARRREIAIASSKDAPELNKIITPILAIGVMTFTFILFSAVMFKDTPVDDSRRDLLIYVLGILSAIAMQIIVYYFGSSFGSKTKDDTIKGLIK